MSKSEIKRFQLEVTGRVQGVGYRAFAFRTAESLQLSGFVRNQYDGSVQIEVEGPEEKVELFIAQCKQGPGWASVKQIFVAEIPTTGSDSFKVTR